MIKFGKEAKSLYLNTSVYGLIVFMMFYFLIQYVFNTYLSHHLSLQAYGNVIFVMRLLVFLLPIILLGTRSSGIKYLSQYYANHDAAHFLGFIKWSVFIFIVAILIFSLGHFISTPILQHYGANQTIIDYHYLVFILPLYAVLNYENMILQSTKYYIFGYGISGLFFYVFILLIAAFCNHILHLNIDFRLIMHAIVCALIIMIVVQTIVIMKRLPKMILSDKQSHYDTSNWLFSSTLMMVVSLIYSSFAVVDLFMIKLLDPSGKAVGEMAILFAVTNIFLYFNEGIMVVLQRKLSVLAEKRDENRIKQVMRQANIMKMVPLTFILLSILLYPDMWLYFFKSSHHVDYNTLWIFSILLYIGYFFSYDYQFLQYAGKSLKLLALLYAGKLLYVIILDIILIPQFGVLGAVIALGSSNIIFGIMARIFYVQKRRELCESD